VAVLPSKGDIKVLNDFYLVLPDKPKLQVDKGSGLTEAVVKAMEKGKLFIPEHSEHAAMKQHMSGMVVTYGDNTKYGGKDIKVGNRVYFGYFCYAKKKIFGTEYYFIREDDLLATECA
jgi:co-chaperonin GroES (HSP10)